MRLLVCLYLRQKASEEADLIEAIACRWLRFFSTFIFNDCQRHQLLAMKRLALIENPTPIYIQNICGSKIIILTEVTKKTSVKIMFWYTRLKYIVWKKPKFWVERSIRNPDTFNGVSNNKLIVIIFCRCSFLCFQHEWRRSAEEGTNGVKQKP